MSIYNLNLKKIIKPMMAIISPTNKAPHKGHKSKVCWISKTRRSRASFGVKPYKGMIFGMSFVVFDDDTGLGQSYYIPVGGGIAGKKEPAAYRKFILK